MVSQGYLYMLLLPTCKDLKHHRRGRGQEREPVSYIIRCHIISQNNSFKNYFIELRWATPNFSSTATDPEMQSNINIQMFNSTPASARSHL